MPPDGEVNSNCQKAEWRVVTHSSVPTFWEHLEWPLTEGPEALLATVEANLEP